MREAVIGIIGGTGGMGRWLADLLKKEGYPVHQAGRKQGMKKEEMAATCNVVVVSVPIEATREVIESVGPLLREDALLMDLTSLKVDPVNAMLQAAHCEVVGCHPLFGPAIASLAGKNVVLCPARGTGWFNWIKDIFERNQAIVTVTTPEKHDRMMSVVQVLNHLHTMHLGLVLAQEGMTDRELSAWSTPVFDAKLQFIKKICLEQPAMYAEILAQNPHLEAICGRYRETCVELEKIVKGNNAAQIVELLEGSAEALWPKS